MSKKQQIEVMGSEIGILKVQEGDYISLTDMLEAKDGEFFISDWLRNRNTIEYLSIWEEVNNPNFNYGECAIIKSSAGLNNYKISVKEWVRRTNAIGLTAKAGRYGGTYAHKDIAFEFGMWISPKFKIFLIKEFQRLQEKNLDNLNWNVKRFLTKINYKIHTDAIKKVLVPSVLSKNEINFVYASEADILNKALFSVTAKEWREKNKEKKGNIRDFATIEQLIVLSNIENMNAEFIKMGIKQSERLKSLNKIAINQMKSLLSVNILKKLN